MNNPMPSSSILLPVRRLLLLALAAFPFAVGCGSAGTDELVVYTALDEEFSRPIFDKFTRDTGIQVLAKYDTESTKTVGLAEAILAEKERPRCDLFWNNELLHTLRLQRAGLLRSYASPVGATYPAGARDVGGAWHGFAARARVLIVNTKLVRESRYPRSITALTDPQWYDRCGVAKPLFGTTATHAACLFDAWGADKAQDFFVRLKKNARVMAGNKQVARAVAAGTLVFGLTDTDDAMVEIEAGRPVAIVYPDQKEDQIGTLLIPNSLALIAGSANSTAADRLVDFLLSPEVEARLAMGPSAQLPLHPASEAGDAVRKRLAMPDGLRPMPADFAAAAEAWEQASAFLRDEFATAK